jgi:hypothetical protein
MEPMRPEVSDQANTSFQLSPASVRPGFESDGGGDSAAGEHRLSPRTEKDIPQEPLAARIRATGDAAGQAEG